MLVITDLARLPILICSSNLEISWPSTPSPCLYKAILNPFLMIPLELALAPAPALALSGSEITNNDESPSILSLIRIFRLCVLSHLVSDFSFGLTLSSEPR